MHDLSIIMMHALPGMYTCISNSLIDIVKDI